MKALVTGSSGLVGSAVVNLLCKKGWDVIGIDNNTRAHLFGTEASTLPEQKRLEDAYKNFQTINTDIRDEDGVKSVFKTHGKFDFIVHAAAQPAHEYSTSHALEDFSLNATGTMVMLETYRHYSPQAVFIQCSSSKVYGDSVNDLPLIEQQTRFDLPTDHPFYEGADESLRLDGNLHSLFGASKACGDIMAQEYGRYFELPIALFRPVCITGKAHKGAKLHGYLAYLVKCIATGQEYTINGYNGKQVRDNIHAHDLATAFYEVYKNPTYSYGQAYNIGGGRLSNNSMLEAISWCEDYLGKSGNIAYSDTYRRGDHKWCIYSGNKFKKNYPKWKITYDNERILKELCDLWQE